MLSVNQLNVVTPSLGLAHYCILYCELLVGKKVCRRNDKLTKQPSTSQNDASTVRQVSTCRNDNESVKSSGKLLIHESSVC
jgi:hypothetical protein